jgi:hypothetical protein
MTEETTSARILREAHERAERARQQRRQATPEDYVFDKAQELFWDVIDGTLHGEKSVDASIPLERWRVEVLDEGGAPEGGGRGRPRRRRERLVKPSVDIMRVENDLFVESSTWWPGQPRTIVDYLITPDGPRRATGRRAFNTYEPVPEARRGLAEPTLWIEHVKKLWPQPEEHEFFFDYCAHMIQRPAEKCNTAIVLSGPQGIGKDATLLPVKLAVGTWNCKNVDPDELFSAYRPWLQSVMLVVDEVRPSKDEFHASSMYNLLKPLIAAPPDVLPLNDKYAKLRYVVNVMRVFMTTNDWLSMYIPAEDRRMFIMHSRLEKDWHLAAGDPEYFARYWAWIEAGGTAQVASWLAARDLAAFKAKREAPRTSGWRSITSSWSAPEDGLSDVLEALGRPPVVFPVEMLNAAFDHKEEVDGLLKSPRKITHRMQKEGYVLVPPVGGDTRWRFQNAETKRDIQARLVFVRQSAFEDQKAAIAAIREHGKDLAARSVNLRSIEGGKAAGF